MSFDFDKAFERIYNIIDTKKVSEKYYKKAEEVYNTINDDMPLDELYRKLNQLKQLKESIDKLNNINNEKENIELMEDEEENQEQFQEEILNNNQENNQENNIITPKNNINFFDRNTNNYVFIPKNLKKKNTNIKITKKKN